MRIHRAGEGAPYTGLKPAGRDLGPAIPAVDRAFAGGSLEALSGFVTNAVPNGIHEHFKLIMTIKNFSADDVEAGREFVKAYVIFMHYVKGIYDATQSAAQGHFEESKEVGMHKD